MPDLALIVPVYNEVDNVDRVIAAVDNALSAIDYELIFVDDNSPDGTASLAWNHAQQNPRVRCLKRLNRRGLSSAVVEGMMATSAPYIAVMDGDLQHDETILPSMLSALQSGDYDLAIGSRYVDGGGTGDWDQKRLSTSLLATKVAQLVSHVDIKDPMSGFFMLRREVIEKAALKLSQRGYKILLDIVLSSPEPLKIIECPYVFRSRMAGESKLSLSVIWEFGMMLADKLLGRYVPTRFISFAFIGGLGIGVHFLVLTLAMYSFGQSFQYGQMMATGIAMIFNYILNNNLTFADRKLRGFAFWRGMLSFIIISSLGALSNVGIAIYLFNSDTYWVTSALVGIVVGAVWNYTISSLYTWKVAVR